MRTLLKSTATTKFTFFYPQLSKRTSHGQETEVCFNRVKRSLLSVVIGRFQSILFVSVFQGSLMTVAIIMIDDSEKTYFVVAVDLGEFACF